jgi:hypothetical protein
VARLHGEQGVYFWGRIVEPGWSVSQRSDRPGDGPWHIRVRRLSMARILVAFMVAAVGLAVGLNATQAKDKDGKSDKKAPKAEEVFKKLDKNGDGKLTKDEFLANFKDPEKAKPLFDKVDTNRDGWISVDEFKAWCKKVEERAKRKSEKK